MENGLANFLDDPAANWRVYHVKDLWVSKFYSWRFVFGDFAINW